MLNLRNPLFILSVLPFLTGCGEISSVLTSKSGDTPSAVQSAKPKVDILWVMDNSNSMGSTQLNFAVYFKNFVTPLENKNLDYRMAVTGTDAYRSLFAGGTVCSQFRDGPVKFNSTSSLCQNTGTHNGVFIMTPETPKLSDIFFNNIRQGTQGHGDERSFQSMRVALEDPLNAGFLRPDSFLAVIIVAEEDDFSHDGSNSLQNVNNYNDPRLHKIKDYTDFLDSYTGPKRKYMVNSMSIYEIDCLEFLNTMIPGRMIGVRIGQLTDATGGVKADVCGSFPKDVTRIAEAIALRATGP